MNRKLTIEQKTELLDAMNDDEDPLGALAAMGVPQPVLVELLERDYAAAEPPKVDPPEPDYETASLPPHEGGLGEGLSARIRCVLKLLEESQAYVQAVDHWAYPDERVVMRSVANDLRRYVLGSIQHRREVGDLSRQDNVPRPPAYHYDRVDEAGEESAI